MSMNVAVRGAVGGCALWVLSACAGVDHYKVIQLPPNPNKCSCGSAPAPDESSTEKIRKYWWPTEADGVRYYGTSLYLLVNSDGKGSIEWRILELPDRTKLMSAHPYTYLASLESSLAFSNGVLLGSRMASDGTVVPRAVISAVSQFVTAIASGAIKAAPAPMPAPPHAEPAPTPEPEKTNKFVRFYKIIVEGDNVSFKGGAACGEPMHVTVGDTFVPEP